MAKAPNIIGDTALNVAAIAVSLLGGFAYQILIARYLGPAGRGEYGVWIAVATVMGVLFTFGADRGIQVQLVARRVTVGQATWTVLLMGVFGSLAAIGLLWLALENQWQFVTGASPQSRMIALLVVPAVALPLALQLLLLALSHFVAFAVISLLRSLVQVAMAALMFIAFGWGVEAAYAALVVSSAITVMAYLVVLGSKYPLEPSLVSLAAARDLLGYSVRYAPARLGNAVNGNLIVLTLALFASKHDIGLFSLALALMGQSLIISQALDRAIQPLLGDKADNQIDLIAQCCRASTLLYAAITLMIVLAAELLVPALFTSSFRESVPLLWILTPGFWIKGATKPLRTYFVGANRPGTISISMLIELLATIASLAVLYPLGGVLGAALGATIGQATGSMFLVAAFHSCTGRNLTGTWIWNRFDTQCLKDHIIELFNIKLEHRTFHSRSAAEKCSRERIPRQVILAPRSVIKKLPDTFFKLELHRTQAIAGIGQASKLFTVPPILDVDSASGTIVFSRLTGLKSIGEVLATGKKNERLVERLGLSLAAIHNELSVSSSIHIPLPEAWDFVPEAHQVCLHGDVTTRNVLYREESDELVIIDCATTDRCGGRASVGPWCFDVAWFVRSLLHTRVMTRGNAVAVADVAIGLLKAYSANRHSFASESEFVAYLESLLSKCLSEQPQQRSLWGRRNGHLLVGPDCRLLIELLSDRLGGSDHSLGLPRRIGIRSHVSDERLLPFPIRSCASEQVHLRKAQ